MPNYCAQIPPEIMLLALAEIKQIHTASISEARSWFKLGRGNEYAIFLSVPMKILCPYKKNSWEPS